MALDKKFIAAAVSCMMAVIAIVVALGDTAPLAPMTASDDEFNVPTRIHHVVAYDSQLGNNRIWCAPFEVSWNNLMDETNGEMEGAGEDVGHLNAQPYTDGGISNGLYYSFSGVVGDEKAVTEQINTELVEVFQRPQDVFSPGEIRGGELMVYAMLDCDVSWASSYDDLGKAAFTRADGAKSSASYFGFESGEGHEAAGRVLYYEDEDHHAVMLDTHSSIKVVLVKGPEGRTSQEIFENLLERGRAWTGNVLFGEGDALRIPKIDFTVIDDFDELLGAHPANARWQEWQIEEARQLTKMKLQADMENENPENGEAGISEERDFSYDGTFAVFLVDGEARLNEDLLKGGNDSRDYTRVVPYFAAKVADASVFQGFDSADFRIG